ncbi:MAG TPA: hypothetical protein VEU47_09840 [Candidatus Cybelea sp.]|nr:hypothetical protein [Candidatus Cybelea sp.]
MAKIEATFGPCCFCGAPIKEAGTDPCRLTVETAEAKWQVWFCHGECFRARLATLEDNPDFFEPAHF